MKVKQLIEELQKVPQDFEVCLFQEATRERSTIAENVDVTIGENEGTGAEVGCVVLSGRYNPNGKQ